MWRRVSATAAVLVTASITRAACAGLDPLECEKPVCGDKLAIFKQLSAGKGLNVNMLKKDNSSAQDTQKNSSMGQTPKQDTSASSTPPPVIVNVDQVEVDWDLTDCPLDRAELGNATWRLLHTMAAHYPENPSQEQQMAALNFIAGLATLYPCPHCAEDFRADVAAHPPKVASRKEFSQWVCERHNVVNEKLGVGLFDCSQSSLNARWRNGKPGCWNYSPTDEPML